MCLRQWNEVEMLATELELPIDLYALTYIFAHNRITKYGVSSRK